MAYNAFVVVKIQAFIFVRYTNIGNLFIISIVLPSDMIWIKSTLHWLYLEHIFIQKDYWHSIKHSLTSYFIVYIQNGYTWESLPFPVRGVGFFIFLSLDNISQYPLFLDDINWTKFVFQCSMQIFYGERKPLKFVSPNIIYIYLLSSSDKFSKKLVDKQISMDEYFMLKVLCKEGWHKSFIIYELEADTKVAVILSETLLEDVMIFMYQIHLI